MGLKKKTEHGMNTLILDRLLAAFVLILAIGLLAWNTMVLNMENRALKRANNHLGLKIAEVDRAMPWIKVLNKNLSEQEKTELDAGIWTSK